MSDPFSAAVTAIVPKTLDILKNRRLYDHIVGGALFILFLKFVLLNTSQASQLVTDPPTITAHVLHLLGVSDTHQIEGFAVWASRPVFAPVLQLCAAAAGIALLWRSSSGAFTAWLLLLFAASGIGWTVTVQCALWSFGAGLVSIIIAAIINRGPTEDGRQWRTPGFIILDTTFTALVCILIAPLNPILVAMRALRRQYTYERAKDSVRRPSPVSFRRAERSAVIGKRLQEPSLTAEATYDKPVKSTS